MLGNVGIDFSNLDNIILKVLFCNQTGKIINQRIKNKIFSK